MEQAYNEVEDMIQDILHDKCELYMEWMNLEGLRIEAGGKLKNPEYSRQVDIEGDISDAHHFYRYSGGESKKYCMCTGCKSLKHHKGVEDYVLGADYRF
jgi:hypothetical protein